MRILNASAIVLLFAFSAAPAVAQSGDPDNPATLPSNVIEGKVAPRKATVSYYRFTAGPGDLKVTADSSTDYYSLPFTIELLSASDSDSIGKLSVTAGDTSKRVVQTFTLNDRRPVLLKIATPEDKTVEWLKYKLRLDGPVELAAAVPAVPTTAGVAAAPAISAQSMASPGEPTPPTASAADMTAPAPSAHMTAAAAEPVSTPATAAASVVSQTTAGSNLLSKVFGGMSVMPSTGMLVITMKDGSVQQIDLSQVKQMTVKKAGS